MERFDLIIIGAGPGGYTAAIKASEYGMNVAVIEKEQIGGTCVNKGCIPTKALINAAERYSDICDSRKFGIFVNDVTYQSDLVYEYKEKSVRRFRDDITNKFEAGKIKYYHGKASLLPYKCVRVQMENGEEIELSSDSIILAVGAKPLIPDIEGIHLDGVMTSDTLVEGETDKYREMIIIGGGVVGVECGNILHGFGCKLTILESKDRILSPLDPEISDDLSSYIEREGVKVCTNAKVKSIHRDEKLVCTYEQKGVKKTAKADHVLVTIGRKSVIEEVLSQGVQLEMQDGKVVIDQDFQTSIPGVFAIGDCIDGIKLAHLAAAQGSFVVSHILRKESDIMLSIVPSCLFIDLPIVPSCIYLNPEIASVGLSETEAVKKGLKVRCGHYSLSENGKAIISDDRSGFVKVVFEATSDVLIGTQIVCERATDMIGEMATAIANSLTSQMLLYAMRAHPTYSEAIAKAVENSRAAK